MRIVILNNAAPFVRGGAEHLADALTLKCQEFGHSSTLIRIPFRWEPAETILDQILACRLFRIPNADLVVAFKFPAYFVPHPNKVLWIVHQFRQAYDFWGTEFQCLPDDAGGLRLRDSIRASDNAFLREAKKIFVNSDVTAKRLKRFNGFDATVLYPPLLTEGHFRCEDYGDYIFAPGRINSTKRQRLLVESMAHCRTGVRLVVAGSTESPRDAAEINSLIAKHRLEKRITFLDRFIKEGEKVDWFSRALGVAYLPYDEDSYGYVTLESYLSAKPVITCSDSGGTNLLVKDGTTGYVVPPEPKALAEAMDCWFRDRTIAKLMGEAGRDLARDLRIDWGHVITSLTQ
jgi:glycosyltransferase involved in cell wall biosynthesis